MPQPDLHVLKKTFILSFNWWNCWATTWRQPVTLTSLPLGTRGRIVFYSAVVCKSTSDKNVPTDSKSWCCNFLRDLKGLEWEKRCVGKHITVCKWSAQCRGVILRIVREHFKSICVNRLTSASAFTKPKAQTGCRKGIVRVFWCEVVWVSYP